MGRAGGVYSVFTQEPLRDFYALRVLKNPSQDETLTNLPAPIENSFNNLRFGRDFMDEFETQLINLTTETTAIELELCHDDHCCLFIIDHDPITSNSTFQYRYVAFNGYRTYSGWGEKKLVICAIIACNDDTLDSCGRMPNYKLANVTFNAIEITTSFNRFGVLMMPNTLDMNMNPLSVQEIFYDEFVSSNETRTSSMSLLEPHSDLQTFALYGHDYEVNEEFDFDRLDGGSSGMKKWSVLQTAALSLTCLTWSRGKFK